MLSKITSKFQITIPKEIRAKLKLHSNDSIEWVIEDSKIYVRNPSNDLLKLRSVVNVGPGDIDSAKKIIHPNYHI